MKFIFLSLIFVAFTSCQDASMLTGKIHVDIKDSYSVPPKIYGVRIDNDQLIVTGKGLGNVSHARFEGSTNHTFSIESKTDGKLILNAKNALSLLVGQTLNLIVSNASASASFPITLELDRMGATAGQFLRFNGTAWAPASITNTQIFAGSYDAATDSPDIVALGGTAGSYYIVAVAGTQDLGSGPESFNVGDWVIFNGSSWFKIEPAGASTYSWSMLTKTAGKLTGSKLSEIADVDITGIQDGDLLQWNNSDSKWEAVPAPAPTITNGSITTTQIADSAIDSAKIIDGSIVDADVSATAAIAQSKISGLTTALNNKEPTLPTGTINDYVRGDKTLGSFSSSFLNTLLSGYASGTAIPITPLDTINQALGKLEAKDAAIITSQANYVPLDGSSAMTGNLQLGGKLITNLGAPSGNTDAATKKYVDDTVAAVGGGSSQWTTAGSDIYYDTGKVGVGVLAPAYKLDVAGDVNITGNFKVNGVNIATTGTAPVGAFGGMFAHGTGTFAGSANPYTSGFSCPTGFTSTTLASAGYNDGSNNFASFNLSYCRAVGGAGGTAAGLNTQFQFNSSGLLAPADVYYVSSNVGVGVTTPTEKLDVAGNIALTGKLRLKSNNANYIELKAPNALASTLTYNLPGTSGTTGQALITDGSGNLSWGDVSVNIQTAVMSSYAVGANAAVANSDTLQGALGKVQGQINALKTSDTNFLNKTGTDTISGTVTVSGSLKIPTTPTGVDLTETANVQYVQNFVGAYGQWSKNGSNVFYNAGDVGIGTSTPTGVLDVQGGSATSGNGSSINLVAQTGANNSNGGSIYLRPGLGQGTGYTGQVWVGASSAPGVLVLTDSTGGWASDLTYDWSSNLSIRNNNTGTIQFHTNDGSGVTERMRISSSGNIGIGTTAPHASAALDVTSTSSGFLLPRVTTAQRNAIASPANGLMVYDIDIKSLFVYQSTVWRQVGGSTHEFRATQVSAVATFPSGTATDVIFTNEEYDVSNSYNVTNGTYTVPEDGTYYFSWTIYLSNVGKLHTRNSELWVDGVVKARSSEVITTGANEGALNGSSLLRLSAGQVVRVRAFGISSDASSVAASANTATQVWNFSGARMGGSGGQAGSDNLGNHLATQNLNLGTYKLVGNGGTSGLSISNAGSVGVGITSPIATLHVNGSIYSGAISTAGTVYQTSSGIANGTNGRVDSAGGNSTACYNSQWGYWGYCTSLRSTKKDIKDLDLGLTTVLKMRPVSFTWKNNDTNDLGFIAEEVEKVDPIMTEYSKGKLSGVKYSSLTSLLTKAIQEFYAEFTGQREEIERLKKENAEMKARLAKIERMLQEK